MKEYVRITLKPFGAKRRITVWARVLKRSETRVSYREVKSDGNEWFGDGDTIRVIVASPAEVVEKPARLNVRYEEMELA